VSTSKSTATPVSTNLFSNVKHLLTLKDLSVNQILHLIRRSLEFKRAIRFDRFNVTGNKEEVTPFFAQHQQQQQKQPTTTSSPSSSSLSTYTIPSDLLAGKTLALLFSKRSTRTRVSAESGWARMGGHPMFLGKDDIQFGNYPGAEAWRDTAVVVSSMSDAVLARLGAHEEIEVSMTSNGVGACHYAQVMFSFTTNTDWTRLDMCNRYTS
jgi:ornithine carbamoyltransferase